MASQVDAVADQIEEAGGWEAGDPQDVHDTIAALPRIPYAVQILFTNIARRLEEHPNIAPATTEAINEFAGQMSAMADQLRQRLESGVMPS